VGRVPAVRYSQDVLIIAMRLLRKPGGFPSGFVRLCCLHMSLKTATKFQLHFPLGMLDFDSVGDSGISCWGGARSGGWLGIGTRLEVGKQLRMGKAGKKKDGEGRGGRDERDKLVCFVRCCCGGGEMRCVRGGGGTCKRMPRLYITSHRQRLSQ
jgi:hypothetical protein